MSDFNDECTPRETYAEMERRHKAEIRKLEGEVRALLKTAKKGNKAQIEAQTIQMQYDLKAKHQQEEDDMDASGVTAEDTGGNDIPAIEETDTAAKQTEEEIVAAKKEKAKKKQDKKKSKDAEKEAVRLQIQAENSGPSRRDIELQQINGKLAGDGFHVKTIISDGNCLYRAIADQLQVLSIGSKEDHNTLRGIAAGYIRAHPEEFCPFLGYEMGSTEFEEYCDKVASLTDAEWGGQLELKALSAALHRPILIYSADAPVLCMNDADVPVGTNNSLKVTFHKHYYALGEHYNSVEPVSSS